MLHCESHSDVSCMQLCISLMCMHGTQPIILKQALQAVMPWLLVATAQMKRSFLLQRHPHRRLLQRLLHLPHLASLLQAPIDHD